MVSHPTDNYRQRMFELKPSDYTLTPAHEENITNMIRELDVNELVQYSKGFAETDYRQTMIKMRINELITEANKTAEPKLRRSERPKKWLKDLK